ncbi:cation-translocating P-type ATPase [Halapricum desulfuricans]|uniref:Cation transport ATPase n=1 Tax=Halapricum desulfuricans TaxID=2841257 RepID=A0A897N2F5_9EURY|nr:cation-transporting P-type ATPase [Halapricum desulfuricans]QSG04506.1 Cation transport ATPase [Halapricum desulfuricans]
MIRDGDVETPWSLSASDVLADVDVAPDEGLSEDAVERRRAQFGPNELREAERKHWSVVLADQFESFIVLLLAVAGFAAFLLGDVVESVAIFAVLGINGAIGFVTEMRAIGSIESLRELAEIHTRVRRAGEQRTVSADELVPGDVVVLQAGDFVPADLRILEPSKLQVDESALTGESVPVGKTSEPLAVDVPLAERENMLYKGTYVTRGSVEAVVVTTGPDTELGHISASLQELTETRTPLQEKLDDLGQTLVPFLLVVATVVLVSGWARGQDLFLMVETAIALTIATVPEGLPIVATLVLARGMWRMADRNALVTDLASVETLGSTTVICTDKTGTLTENRMTVAEYELASGPIEVTGVGLETEGAFRRDGRELAEPEGRIVRDALEVGVLCNNADVTERDGGIEAAGDPMEVALLIAGRKAGIDREDLGQSMPEVREVSFDPAVKMMATYHEADDTCRVAVKGAPEAVVEASTQVVTADGTETLSASERAAWLRKSERMAEEGLRVLALAQKETATAEASPYEDLTLLGLVGFVDPPREEVRSTIERCQDAGIRVVMVTGDHAGTARNIAYSVGLVDEPDAEVIEGRELGDRESISEAERDRFVGASVFARVSPEHKLDLIDLHQSAGSIVAMTGDGVNDAPALKRADIGVAMGQRGTQVAQEASDMILRDDNFQSIYHAVREGRVIFSNIRKFVLYLMSCNLSELLAILIASLLGFPLPLLPLQILFLNVVTDIFPAFALGACGGSDDIMDRPPRDPDEPIMTRTNWTELGFYGVVIALATVGAFVIGGRVSGGMATDEAVTISFLTLAFAQLWHVFDVREVTSGILRNEVTENPYVWGALGLSTLILVGAVYLPGISLALGTAPIGVEAWSIVLAMSLLPLVVGQLEREARRRFGANDTDGSVRSSKP